MEEEIYTYLIMNNVGKENMIKNVELRKIFQISSDRSIRKLIQNIRESEKYYLVVGSESGNTGGFFICKSKEEIEETIDNIRHRANRMHRMCHILEWKLNKVIDE